VASECSARRLARWDGSSRFEHVADPEYGAATSATFELAVAGEVGDSLGATVGDVDGVTVVVGAVVGLAVVDGAHPERTTDAATTMIPNEYAVRTRNPLVIVSMVFAHRPSL
jgi:hypothetical protein